MLNKAISGEATCRRVKVLKAVLVGAIAAGVCVVAGQIKELTAQRHKLNEQRPHDLTARLDGRETGSLVICGGGGLPEELKERFVQLAGGRKARIVVIPTAHPSADAPDADKDLDVWKALGVASVRLLHTRSREKANDPAFVEPLSHATGVWLGGGDQTRLTEPYLGTEVEKHLKGLLDRGGVIGGISAGAAAMTHIMIASGRTKATEGEGFDFLPGAVIDQHFMMRNRLKRLLDLLARHPGLVGFGIDERTALVVRGKRLSVIGDSYVMACVPGSEGRPPRMEVLKRGDYADLRELQASATDADDDVLISNRGQ